VAKIDSTISKYNAEIQNLELQKATILTKEDLMKKEANVAIQKVKESKMSQQEIATLVDNGKALDERLTDLKSQLDKLKSEFVI
jgi:lipase chaperone LimK